MNDTLVNRVVPSNIGGMGVKAWMDEAKRAGASLGCETVRGDRQY